MIFLYIIPLCFSAGLGISINGAYYRTSFLHSGYGDFYALGLAIAFMLFESILWMYVGKNKAISFLKISIVIFSVFITLGAQFFSTSMKESETAEIIYEKTDISGDVEYYRDQIKTQDERINQIFRQRENDFVFTRTEESLSLAQSEKEKYESLLRNSQDKKDSDIQNINSPKTIYSWLAYDLPEIFRSGVSENLVRLIFQLFSSVLLALMAPVSLSMIRMYLKARSTEIDNPVRLYPENKATFEAYREPEEIKADPEPVKQPEPKPVNRDLDLILDMLLYYYPESGLLPPEKAADFFINVHKSRPNIKSYTIEECREVYEKILQFDGMEKHEIKEEGLKL